MNGDGPQNYRSSHQGEGFCSAVINLRNNPMWRDALLLLLHRLTLVSSFLRLLQGILLWKIQALYLFREAIIQEQPCPQGIDLEIRGLRVLDGFRRKNAVRGGLVYVKSAIDIKHPHFDVK
ncbi:hypothetical protein AVEN_250475-1 [Araneus ventricosus]|uniref:Uncharacterized protein n=1 Tax=Araneus ventricosus TaxID=182803 RepID=A0A4Y2IHH7_ARAVE|nr:hypothetical protein AVEN_250475-1 [Araneus ventricosus]